MEIPKLINFENLKVAKNFRPGSPEYKALDSFDEEGEWKDYCNSMLQKGISVTYDTNNEYFSVKPTKSKINEWQGQPMYPQRPEMEEYEEEEDNIGIEDDLEGIEDEEEPQETEINKPQNNTMQVVSLDDVLNILKQSIGSEPQKQTMDTLADQGGLAGGDQALKSSYFQSEGNQTLDSDFPDVKEEIDSFEQQKTKDESYLESIDGFGNEAFKKFAKDFNQQLKIMGIDRNEFIKEFQNNIDTDPSCEQFTEAPVDELSPVDYTGENTEDKELLLDKDEETMNEDIMPGIPEEEEEMMPDYQEPVAIDAIDTNEQRTISGMPVQIILTGVMITPTELNYIGECVQSAGNKLKKIEGKGDKLSIVIEANNKQYTINYQDSLMETSKTPFSIKKHKFTSLNEALDVVNRKSYIEEKRVFNTIMNSDLSGRNITGVKESNIFEGYENVKYVSGWNVSTVGQVNLKNGLNETYSNILEHGTEPNTLVLNEDNQYFLIKGNLKERSKEGTVKELLDTKNKKNYGIVKVIGIFENTAEGLGDVMYEIKKTSIPLLVWK